MEVIKMHVTPPRISIFEKTKKWIKQLKARYINLNYRGSVFENEFKRTLALYVLSYFHIFNKRKRYLKRASLLRFVKKIHVKETFQRHEIEKLRRELKILKEGYDFQAKKKERYFSLSCEHSVGPFKYMNNRE